jgi:hypothetical protein
VELRPVAGRPRALCPDCAWHGAQVMQGSLAAGAGKDESLARHLLAAAGTCSAGAGSALAAAAAQVTPRAARRWVLSCLRRHSCWVAFGALARELAAAVVPSGDLGTAELLTRSSLALLCREGHAEASDSASGLRFRLVHRA